MRALAPLNVPQKTCGERVPVAVFGVGEITHTVDIDFHVCDVLFAYAQAHDGHERYNPLLHILRTSCQGSANQRNFSGSANGLHWLDHVTPVC